MKGNFVIKQMMGGGRNLRLEPVKGSDAKPLVFPRNTAAYAFLITRLEARGVQSIFKEDDAENPGCMDIMADFGGALEQYAIEAA
jgi:hypothetical protein